VQPVVVQADRHGHVRTSHVFGNEGQGFGVGLVAPQVGHRHAEELRQRVHQAPLLEDAHVDKKLAESFTGCRLQLQRLLDLRVRDQATQDEDVTELLAGAAGGLGGSARAFYCGDGDRAAAHLRQCAGRVSPY
jgi:hypothetical protein